MIRMASAGDPFHLKDKVVVLRQFRLGRTPPALHATQLLREAGYACVAIEFGFAFEAQRFVDGDPPRWRLAHPFALRLPRWFRRPLALLSVFFRVLWRVMEEGRPLCFVSHGLSEQLLALALSWVTGAPFVAHVHEGFEASDPLSPFNRLLFRLEGIALRQARFLIFPVAERERLYRERYSLEAPSVVVYNAPRLRAEPAAKPRSLRERLGAPSNSVLLAYVGGIGEENLLEEAVHALREIPRAHLVAWGWGSEEYLARLRAAARASSVEARVHLLGELDEEKWEWLEGCDIGYAVYRPTTFRLRHSASASNKLMEYWAAGLPATTSSETDYRRFLTRFDAGVCAPELSAAGVSAALRRLVDDEAERRRLAENARQAHRECLHYEAQFREALALFRRELSPAGAREIVDIFDTPLFRSTARAAPPLT
jgi:glycosyltransferase involved in cell wall biosynthesis